MPGFGHNKFGAFPFGHFDWSRTVLYRMLPELHQRQDADQGYPLATLVEGERPSLESLRQKIQRFGELRDPVLARSQYNEIELLTLGKKVVTKGAVLQRGTNGTITAFGEFISPSVRFNQTHAGKILEISRSSDPSHNQEVLIAQVDPAIPTRAVIAPPLGLDAGLLTWELRDAVVEPTDRTFIEVTFGEPSVLAPGWILFDGSSEFEVLARTQLTSRTEREGSDGTFTGTSSTLTGTITVVAGETTVTGVGTLFPAEVAAGGYLRISTQRDTSYTKIAKVLSNTSLVLAGGYAGDSDNWSASYEFHQFTLSTNAFTLEDIGKRITVSGSAITSNDDKYEIENVLKLNPLDTSYQLAVLRRVGPSDHVVAGTPIKADAGPLDWAILPRTQLTLKGRAQVIRGLMEQSGYDAQVMNVGPDIGIAGSITAASAGVVTFAGLAGMTVGSIGRLITIFGAANPSNNGIFRVSAYVSPTSIKYENTAGVFPDPNSGFIGSVTLLSDEALVEMPSGRFSPDLGGNRASITTAVTTDGVRSVTIIGLAGMEPSCVGQQLIVTNAATATNNSATPFTITKYINASSVVYTNPNGVAADANNGVIGWFYNSPDRGKLLTLRGPGTNNGTVEVIGVSSTTTSITVAQRVIPQIGNPALPALPDLADPFTVPAPQVPMEWELRTATTIEGNSENPAYLQTQVRAPSLLQYLAKDFGIDVDIRETEDRQRSWVKNNSRWIGIKGLAKAYSILGDISGFSIIPEALYRISQDMSLAIPPEFLHETGEYELGRSSPNPANPTTRDGTLSLGFGGKIQLYSPTALFRKADEGLQIRIQQAAVAGNNKLYTVDQYLSPTTVLFRLLDTATLPEANNGNLQWNLARLYTTKPPLRARFDDLDPDLFGQLINPTATTYLTGATSDGDILYVSQVRGALGNGVRIAHVALGGPPAAPVVTVVGYDVTVSYTAGTTAAAVAIAVAAAPAANILLLAVPQHSGIGVVGPHAFTVLAGGADHFALDKFCWEDTFDSSVDGLLPFRADSPDFNGRIQYTAGVDGGYGVRITHNNVVGGATLVTVVGTQVTVTYDASAATANDVVAAFLANATASTLVIATAQGTGVGLFAPTTSRNNLLNIVSVAQVAENLWGVTISGSMNAVLDIQGGNWRVTDSNGVDFFLESAPVASGANWAITAFSAVAPIVGPIVLNYDCSTVFSCDYCAASKVLLTIEPTTVLNDSQNSLALELILNRMIGRIGQVTPAHVQPVMLFTSTLSASFNLQAYVEAGMYTSLPLIAPFQAYYDMFEGDIFPLDAHIVVAVSEGPYYSFNAGAIGPVVGVTATLSGFTNLVTNVIGQNLVITGAATVANNGTFPITGYTANTIDYTNAAAVAGDANNGIILATTTP